MAETWPSGAPTASDIDFRTKFTKVTLIPNKNGCLVFSLAHLGPRGGRKWPKLGHLDHCGNLQRCNFGISVRDVGHVHLAYGDDPFTAHKQTGGGGGSATKS